MYFKPQVKNSLDLNNKKFHAIDSSENIAPGAQKEFFASGLSAESNTYLVYNPIVMRIGSLEVMKREEELYKNNKSNKSILN